MKHLKAAGYLVTALALIAPCSSLGVANDVTSWTGDTFTSYGEGATVIGSNGWEADTNEVIAAGLTTNMTYSGALPISGTGPVGSTMVLNLEAGANVLTNEFTGVSTNTWIDMMVRMNPADETPAVVTNDTSVHFAVYLNASSNLVLLHGTNLAGVTYANTLSVIPDKVIDSSAEEWIRLTMAVDYLTSVEPNGSIYMQLIINGNTVTNDLAYSAPVVLPAFPPSGPGAPDGGTWWLMANWGSAHTSRMLSSLNLSGAGYFDNIIATASDPFSTPATMYTVTVASVTGGTISPSTPQAVSDGGTVAFTYTLNPGSFLQSYTNTRDGVVAATGTTYHLINVTEHITLGGVFASDTTTLSNGVPEGWLQQTLDVYTGYGAKAAADDDNDGYTAADEFLWSTDPTDSNSVPRIASIDLNGGAPRLRWESDWDVNYFLPGYAIMYKTNMTAGSWTFDRTVARSGGPATNEVTLAVPAQKYYYYRVVATNAP